MTAVIFEAPAIEEIAEPDSAEDDLNNLLDECDRAMQGLGYDEIMEGFGGTSSLSCEERYLATVALVHRTQLTGGKRIL